MAPAELYHVTSVDDMASIQRDGIEPRSGSWNRHKWVGRVFLTTTLMSAMEMAMMFAEERTRGRDFIILTIDPSRIPKASFRPDKESEFGVWTKSRIPPEAITGTKEVDLESDEFRSFMGLDDEEEE